MLGKAQTGRLWGTLSSFQVHAVWSFLPTSKFLGNHRVSQGLARLLFPIRSRIRSHLFTSCICHANHPASLWLSFPVCTLNYYLGRTTFHIVAQQTTWLPDRNPTHTSVPFCQSRKHLMKSCTNSTEILNSLSLLRVSSPIVLEAPPIVLFWVFYHSEVYMSWKLRLCP